MSKYFIEYGVVSFIALLGAGKAVLELLIM